MFSDNSKYWASIKTYDDLVFVEKKMQPILRKST